MLGFLHFKYTSTQKEQWLYMWLTHVNDFVMISARIGLMLSCISNSVQCFLNQGHIVSLTLALIEIKIHLYSDFFFLKSLMYLLIYFMKTKLAPLFFHFKHWLWCSRKHLNLLNISVYPKCRWVCFFTWKDLEKFSIISLAHQWIVCSEWVPSEWVQIADKNITIIHK